MDGNFGRRFSTAGALNAPWGITQASANFGSFSNNILIGNIGDGDINAYDLATGNFVGKLKDGNGNAIANPGLHGLAFRSDGFGTPDTLYFTSQFNDDTDGLFGAVSTGMVSLTRVSGPNTTINTSVTITANVAAALNTAGTPTGTVTFKDGSLLLGTATLVDGSATLDANFTATGIHSITAQYSGDGVFLISSNTIPLQVTGLSTMAILTTPADAAPGSTVLLTATINSAGGMPTGQVLFLDGSSNLGASALDAAGVAILRISTLAAGTHSLTASYAGDSKFEGSTSAEVTINIANVDFSLGAAPTGAAVIAGQSTQFIVTVSPQGGFANNVTFSCAPVTGITCAFSPATVTPAGGAVSATLTVTASASVARFGLLMPGLIGLCSLLVAFAFFGLAIRRGVRIRTVRASLLTATAVVAIVAAGLAIAGCGGYGGSTQANRGTASIVVTAQSGTISHATTVLVTVQ
jgi:Big-like domain-containing protein